MPTSPPKSENVGHPAPYREQVSMLYLYFGLFGAPAAWVVQMGLSQIFTSYACYPHRTPLDTPLWEHLPLMLSCVSSVCSSVGIFSVIAACMAWRQSKHELAAHKGHVAEVGEGRTKFFAMLAILSSMLFIVAILFTASALFLVAPCGA